MENYKRVRPKKVFILIAPHFDEESVVCCLSQMRAKGLAVQLIGSVSGWMSGLRGLKVLPDSSLAQMDPLDVAQNQHVVVIPGGDECVANLLSDPRTHELVETVLNTGGTVAAMSPAQQVLAGTGVPGPDVTCQFFSQGSQNTADFVTQLVKRVTLL